MTLRDLKLEYHSADVVEKRAIRFLANDRNKTHVQIIHLTHQERLSTKPIQKNKILDPIKSLFGYETNVSADWTMIG